MPIASATISPLATSGRLGGNWVSWLATRSHSTKHPAAITIPPTSEAMFRLRGSVSLIVMATAYSPAMAAVERALDRTLGRSWRMKRVS
jgi:hypothetical protein